MKVYLCKEIIEDLDGYCEDIICATTDYEKAKNVISTAKCEYNTKIDQYLRCRDCTNCEDKDCFSPYDSSYGFCKEDHFDSANCSNEIVQLDSIRYEISELDVD